jgi:hypothetical protein
MIAQFLATSSECVGTVHITLREYTAGLRATATKLIFTFPNKEQSHHIQINGSAEQQSV